MRWERYDFDSKPKHEGKVQINPLIVDIELHISLLILLVKMLFFPHCCVWCRFVEAPGFRSISSSGILMPSD